MNKLNNRYVFGLLPAILTLVLIICFACSSGKSDTPKNDTRKNETTATNKTETTVTAKAKETPTLHIVETTEEMTTSDGKLHYTEDEYHKLIDFNATHPFLIRVNKTLNRTMIYGLNKSGDYAIPYKLLLCSTGLYDGNTPVGTYSVSDKYEWRLMIDGSYAQYAIRIYDHIMLHSVPYYRMDNSTLEVDEFNKLGERASLGCVRLNVADIKWIYENCPVGTVVEVYEDADEEYPLTEPEKYTAKSEGKYAGWDPTDPNPNNPYLKKKN